MDRDNEDDEDSFSSDKLDQLYENPFDTFLESYFSNISSLHSLFESLPTDTCSQISKNSRERIENDTSTLAYAEIDFEHFGSFILNLFKNLDLDTKNEQLSFVDIGCGVGKAVFAAYMMNIFSKSTGIELISDLHITCQTILREYRKHFLNSPTDLVNIDFILGDGTYIDWSAYDVAFVYASCFDSKMMHRLTEIANKLSLGALFICISNSLDADQVTFDLISCSELQVAGGDTVTVYVYRRNIKPIPGITSDSRKRLMEILS